MRMMLLIVLDMTPSINVKYDICWKCDFFGILIDERFDSFLSNPTPRILCIQFISLYFNYSHLSNRIA